MAYEIAIDPGLSGTGIAAFNRNEILPSEVVTIYAKNKQDSFDSRAFDIATQVGDYLTMWNLMHGIRRVYCEKPKFMEMGIKGSTAAASDGLVRLCYCVGGIGYICHSLGLSFSFIDVNLWKGQMDKEITIRRMKRKYPTLETIIGNNVDHAWDAVGIGIYAREKFNVTS